MHAFERENDMEMPVDFMRGGVAPSSRKLEAYHEMAASEVCSTCLASLRWQCAFFHLLIITLLRLYCCLCMLLSTHCAEIFTSATLACFVRLTQKDGLMHTPSNNGRQILLYST